MTNFLTELINGPLFQLASWFLAIFPVMIAALSVNSSRIFLLNRVRVETESLNPHPAQLEESKPDDPCEEAKELKRVRK